MDQESELLNILHLWVCASDMGYGVRGSICLWYFPSSFIFSALLIPLNGRYHVF